MAINPREIRMIFDKFDQNHDGKISVGELKDVLEALGFPTSPEEVALMVDVIDSNEDGCVDFKDFEKLLLNGSLANPEDELRSAFQAYDLDNNGLISPDELHEVMNKMGEKCSLAECQKIIAEVDSDGDGYIDFNDFEKMMTTRTM